MAVMRLSSIALVAAILTATPAAVTFAQATPTPAPTPTTMILMTHHAYGTFTVKRQPVSPAPAEGLARFSMDKEIHGDLEATSKGEMLTGGDYKLGEAGYVAIEVVTGTLDGKAGSFALQQMATMDKSGQTLTVVIVPGSGTGALKGIAGTFSINVVDGQHRYDLDYTLPA